MAYRGADGKTVGMINECDDGILFEGFEKIARHSHAVACVHCENTEIIGGYYRSLQQRLFGLLDSLETPELARLLALYHDVNSLFAEEIRNLKERPDPPPKKPRPTANPKKGDPA